MANNRASIIIPAYNAARYIGKAIASVQEQSVTDIELLIVDDCSQDGTLAVARQAAAQDPRVRVFRMSANAGPSAARNFALRQARGEWIVLLDADDWFHCRRIETLLELGEGMGADLVVDRQMIVDETRAEPDRPMLGFDRFLRPAQVSFTDFMQRSLGDRRFARGVSWGALKPAYRRAFLEKHGLEFDPMSRWAEDYLLHVACFLHGAVMWVTPEPMYYYMFRRGSLSDTPRLGDLWHIIETDRRVLCDPMVQSDADLRRAVRRHVHAHERWFYYRRFVDQAKAGRLRDALRAACENLASLRYVASEAMIQTPRILAKALRGGYANSMLPHLPAGDAASVPGICPPDLLHTAIRTVPGKPVNIRASTVVSREGGQSR